ncbi:hypothetical protein ACHAQH_004946 [Verticillium albo-atrum]
MVDNYGRAPGHLREQASIIAEADDVNGLRRRNLECRASARYRGQPAQEMKEDGTLAAPKPESTSPALIAGQGRPVDQLVRALREPDLAIARDRKRKRDDEKGASVGMGITLEKLFGVSGRGIAGLVNVPAVNGDEPYQAVCKVDRRHINDVEKEEGLLRDFQGYKHIVQYDRNTQHFKDLRRSKKVPNKTSVSHYRDRINIGTDWKRNFVMMEYAELGNLLTWLQRTSAHAADPNSALGPWPDKALWQLLECITLGLVGIAYAPNGRDDDGPVDVNDETIPPAPAPAIRRRTHFDLDPGNVFVNNFGQGHDNRPTFKIGDFEIMQDFSLADGNPEAFPERKFWQLRGVGKSGYYVPEQFCQEWDNFRDFMGIGDNENRNRFLGQGLPKPPVAGNYGMASNVFQVGIILWMAITLHVPPGTKAFDKPQEDSVGVVVDSVFTRMNGQTVRTYGGALEDERFHHVEGELRELIIRCMAHDPADRPHLTELVRTIDSRLQNPFDVDGAELDQWYQDLFGRPSPQADEDDIDEPLAAQAPKRPRTGFSNIIANERAASAGARAANVLTEESLQTLRDALGIAKAMNLRAAANPVFGELVNVLQRVPGIEEEQDVVMHGAGVGDNGGGDGAGGRDILQIDVRGDDRASRGKGKGKGKGAAGKKKQAPATSRRETRFQAKSRMAAGPPAGAASS